MNTQELQLSDIVAGAWRMANWQMTPEQRLDWIEQCLARGITSIDHADIYGDYQVQRLFGEALRLKPGVRDQLQLVSKCGIALLSGHRPTHQVKHYNTSAAHITLSVERSLQELQTDRLDLLLIHRPDPLMDADEVARTFEDLQRQGKVLHFGVSNHTPAQFSLLDNRFHLATNQIELSALQTTALTDGVLDQAQQLRRRPMVWSPLGGGQLFNGQGDRVQRTRAALQGVANSRGVSLATAAYAWVLRHPSRPHVVTGTSRPEGLQEAVDALRVHMNVQQWTQVWAASLGHDVP
jgi:predicted oxidoreductase